MAKRAEKKATLVKARKSKRQKGSLKSQQVSGRVFWRYDKAFTAMLLFWKVTNFAIEGFDCLDDAATEYIESIYQEGSPLALATDSLAALQYFIPLAQGKLREAWRMCRVWRRVEPPQRVRPFTPLITLGLAGACVSIGAIDLAALLLVGFDGFLRTGELFALTPLVVSFHKNKAILKLSETKTSHRKLADEMVVVESQHAVSLLKKACRDRPKGSPILTMTPVKARLLLKSLLASFGLETWGFNFYSLRRGGATAYFFRTGSMEKTLAKGRWETASTARIYIHEASAQAGELTLSPGQRALLVEAAQAVKSM